MPTTGHLLILVLNINLKRQVPINNLAPMTECPHQRNCVRHFIYQVHTVNKNIRTPAIYTTGQSSTAKLIIKPSNLRLVSPRSTKQSLNETNENVAYIQQVFANIIPTIPATLELFPFITIISIYLQHSEISLNHTPLFFIIDATLHFVVSVLVLCAMTIQLNLI